MKEPNPQFKAQQEMRAKKRSEDQLLADTQIIRENFANGMGDPQIQDAKSYIKRLDNMMMQGNLDKEQGLFIVEHVVYDLERFYEDVNRDREPGRFVPDYLKEDGSVNHARELLLAIKEWAPLDERNGEEQSEGGEVVNFEDYTDKIPEGSTEGLPKAV